MGTVRTSKNGLVMRGGRGGSLKIWSKAEMTEYPESARREVGESGVNRKGGKSSEHREKGKRNLEEWGKTVLSSKSTQSPVGGGSPCTKT